MQAADTQEWEDRIGAVVQPLARDGTFQGVPALRSRSRYLTALRQVIESESANEPWKGHVLDLARHGGRTKPGVLPRLLQRLLALTAVRPAERNERPRRTRPTTRPSPPTIADP